MKSKTIACLFLAFGFYVPTVARAEESVLPPKEERYPVLYGALQIKQAYEHPDSWQGRSVSVEGTVTSVVLAPNGKPSFELQLEDDTQGTIWAMFPQRLGTGSEPRLGERLRVAGWVQVTAAWEQRISFSLPRQHPLTLLTNCIVSLPSYEAMIDKNFLSFCAAWQRAESLPDMAR